jgi:hypothetical protein
MHAQNVKLLSTVRNGMDDQDSITTGDGEFLQLLEFIK